jgi:TP901 family phage tail tape measure protein
VTIAAALNILVTAPTSQLRADFKELGTTVGAFNRVMKEAFDASTTAADRLEQKLKVLRAGRDLGVINQDQFANAERGLTLVAGEERISALRTAIQERYATYAKFLAQELTNYQREINEAMVVDEERVSALRTAIQERYAQKARFEAETLSAFQAEIDKARIAREEDMAALRKNIEERYAQQQLKDDEQKQLRQEIQARKMELQIQREASLKAQKDKMLADGMRDAEEHQQAFNDAKSRANALMANISPYTAHNQRMAEYNRLLAMGALAQEEFNRLQRASQRELSRTTSLMSGAGSQIKAALGFFNPWLVATVAIGAAVREGMKFHQAMSQVAAVGKLTGEQLTALSQSALVLSGTSRYSALQIAEAQQHLVKAGMDVNQTMFAQRHILDLATIGHMDLANASEIVVRAMGAFGMSGIEAGKVVDALAVASSKTIGTVENLAEALKFVGPIAHSSGLSLNETVAALMVLHKQGLVGEMAGTGLRNVLVRLGAPTKEAVAAMRQFGVEIAVTAKGGLDLARTLMNLQNASKSLTGLDQLKFYAELGKTRAAMTVAALTSGDFGSSLADLQNDKGEAQRRAEIAMDNLGGDMAKLGNVVRNSAIAFEESLDPALRAIVQFATNFLSGDRANYNDKVSKGMSAEVENLSDPNAIKARIAELKEFVSTIRKTKGDMSTALFFPNTEYGMSGNVAMQEIELLRAKLAEKSQENRTAAAPFVEIGTKAESIIETLHKKLDEAKGLSAEQSELNDLQQRYNDLIGNGVNEEARRVGIILAAAQLKEKEVESEKSIAAIRKAVYEAEKKNKNETEADRLRREAMEAEDARYEFELLAANIDQAQQAKAEADHKARTLEIEKQTAALRKEILKAETSIFDEKMDKALKDVQLEERIWREEHRKADAWDKIVEESKKFGKDEIAKAQRDAAMVREMQKNIKRFEDVDKETKRLQEKVDNPAKEISPVEKFEHDFADLVTELKLGLIDDKRFAKDREGLEKEFLKSGAHHVKPAGAIERGSKEEFQILYGNPLLDINRRQLKAIELSKEQLVIVNTQLGKVDKPPIAIIPR